MTPLPTTPDTPEEEPKKLNTVEVLALLDKTSVPQRAVAMKASEFARALVFDEEYRVNLLKRLRAGTAGRMESLIWAYSFGTPVQNVDMTVRRPETTEFSQMSTLELAARAEAVLLELRSVNAVEAELVTFIAEDTSPVRKEDH